MRDYLKEFSGDVIGDFLVDNDISKILKEGTGGVNAPVDDGPPTFYKNLTNYKKETKLWIDSLQNDESLLNSLKSISNKNKGHCGLIIHLKSENGMVQRIRASKIGVNASKDFIQNLRDVFGNAHVWIS